MDPHAILPCSRFAAVVAGTVWAGDGPLGHCQASAGCRDQPKKYLPSSAMQELGDSTRRVQSFSDRVAWSQGVLSDAVPACVVVSLRTAFLAEPRHSRETRNRVRRPLGSGSL
jgi:hypothetical protein